MAYRVFMLSAHGEPGYPDPLPLVHIRGDGPFRLRVHVARLSDDALGKIWRSAHDRHGPAGDVPTVPHFDLESMPDGSVLECRVVPGEKGTTQT